MAVDARGNVTNAIMNSGPTTRGGPQFNSPYGAGFTSFAPPRPQAAPQAGGFVPPPGASGAALFAPPPGSAPPAGLAAPPTGGLPPAAGAAPMFAAPPVPGAAMPSNVVPHHVAPAFNAQFSPGALANPGGNAMRGRGY